MITASLSNIRRSRVLAAVIGLSALLAEPGAAQVTPVGGIARNFTVTNRANGQPINLTDFAGKILVIDFFAYWCGPCQSSSPDVETSIQKYYAARGGNAFGVPVQVLAASIDASSPSQTDAFVANAGLELVAEDNGGWSGAWSQFNSVSGIPLFVILNCVAGSPSHAQWQVLYKQAGYAGAVTLRGYIDAVKASVTDPEIAVAQPAETDLSDGSASISFGSVSVGSASGLFTFTIKNTGSGTLTGLAITKDGTNSSDFSVISNPVAPVSGPSGSTTFTVKFTPGAAGARTAAIHIASNDPDENPFDINLTGTGLISAIQSWRQTYFGATGNTGNAADIADPDKDGLNNLLEFAFDLHPLQNSAHLAPKWQRSGNSLVCTFAQPAGVSSIAYVAEWSTSLAPGSWQALSDTGTPPQHTFTVPIDGNTKKFVRLRVAAP